MIAVINELWLKVSCSSLQNSPLGITLNKKGEKKVLFRNRLIFTLLLSFTNELWNLPKQIGYWYMIQFYRRIHFVLKRLTNAVFLLWSCRQTVAMTL